MREQRRLDLGESFRFWVALRLAYFRAPAEDVPLTLAMTRLKDGLKHAAVVHHVLVDQKLGRTIVPHHVEVVV